MDDINKYLIFIVILLVVMALTNPSKQEYISWVKEQAIVQSGSDNLEKDFISFFGSPFIDSATTTKRYIFFSIYETKFDANTHIEVVGALNLFLPLHLENNIEVIKNRLAKLMNHL